MNSKVEEFTDEDVAYVRSLDLKDGSWKTVEEMPLLKALQEKKGIRKPSVPRKHIYTRLDADILAWLKDGGRYYQARMNAILREEMEKDLRSAKTGTGAEQ